MNNPNTLIRDYERPDKLGRDSVKATRARF
jgi:hypothetical protein